MSGERLLMQHRLYLRTQPRKPSQLMLGLTWSGDVPSQKWMNFYTKVITKLGVGHDLSLKVKVKCNPQGGVSKQKIKEIKSVLRELGLDDNLGD
jgi:hypothetical protein